MSDRSINAPKLTTQPTVRLGDLVTMPQLGLGVWQIPASDVAAVVTEAVTAGYKAVDTAAAYENEAGVGDALVDHPDTFVTTKLWNSDQGFDETLRAFDVSAGKLRRNVIDLYLIHWPAPHRDQYVESWRALTRLKQEGRVRAIGVSNFTPTHIQRIIDEVGETPAINQIELHPKFQRHDARAFHDSHGVVTQSWSPLGQGSLLSDPVLTQIALRHGKTVAQIIIAWHLAAGVVVIPKSLRPERLRENIGVFDIHLDDQDIAQISALDHVDGRIGPDPDTATF